MMPLLIIVTIPGTDLGDGQTTQWVARGKTGQTISADDIRPLKCCTHGSIIREVPLNKGMGMFGHYNIAKGQVVGEERPLI